MIASVIPLMPKPTKTCKRCGDDRPKEDFVSRFGFANTRGRLCRECWEATQKDEVRELMDGRDACLYCGTVIPRPRDYDESGTVIRTHIHMDHMDPVSRGGYDPFTYDLELGDFTEDTSRNILFCCSGCNLKKSDALFLDWLTLIPPENRELARMVYRAKNGFDPEEFTPQDNLPIEFVINIDSEPEAEDAG